MIDIPQNPMSEAPKDGRTVILGDAEFNEIAMHWNPVGTNEYHAPGVVGMWQTVFGGYTWHEDEVIGPKYWRPI